MERDHHNILVVLTADQGGLERARRISRLHAHVSLWWLATEPGDLLAALYPATAPQPEPMAFRIVGVILDLTSPATIAYTPSPDRNTLEMAWRLADMLMLQRALQKPPVLVLSSEPGVDTRLRRAGLIVAAQVAPDADDDAWRLALRSLSATDDSALNAVGGPPPQRLMAPTDAAVPLGADLWFEPRRCAVIRHGRHITLTAHEYQVLSLLLQMPGRFISTRMLANHLERPEGPAIDDHSVEQTISGLRRKLGETARSWRLLQTLRGIGYRIILEVPAAGGDVLSVDD